MIKDNEILCDKMILIKDIIDGENEDKILVFEEAICDLSILVKNILIELSFYDILYIIEEIL